MIGFGFAELIVMLALGSPLGAATISASNPLLGLAGSTFLGGPGLLAAAGAAMFLRSSSAVTAPPMPASPVPPSTP